MSEFGYNFNTVLRQLFVPGVWRFPQQFLSGIGVGYLKLDIVLVYLVSTFAVAASGAVVLAATEELLARTSAAESAARLIFFWSVSQPKICQNVFNILANFARFRLHRLPTSSSC